MCSEAVSIEIFDITFFLRLLMKSYRVIILFFKLFLKIFEWSGAKVIYVPKVGLSDGMIRELYKNKN